MKIVPVPKFKVELIQQSKTQTKLKMASQSSDLASVTDDHNMDTTITIKTEIMDVPEHIIFQINQEVKSEPGNLENYFEVNHSNIKNEPDLNAPSISNQENTVHYKDPLEIEPDSEQAPSTIAQNIVEQIIEKQSKDCYRQEKNITDLDQVLTNITQNMENEQKDALEQEQHRNKDAFKKDPIIIKLEREFPDDIPKNTDKTLQSEPITKVIEDRDMIVKIEHNIQVSTEEEKMVTKQESVNIGCIANNTKKKARNSWSSTGIAVIKPIFRNTSCKIENKNMCSACCKLMKTKSLKKHMAIYSRSRPYVCQYCDRDFVYKFSMERHIRIHIDPEEYLCYVCNTKFDNRDRFHSVMEIKTDNSHEERKRQIYDSSDDEKVEKRLRKNREKCKRYREKKKKKVAALSIVQSLSYDFDDKKREEERKQKNREKSKRCREKKKNEVAAVSISGLFDSDEKTREEKRKQKNREKSKRYREKKKNEIGVDALSMTTADSSSDSSGTKMEQARQKRINAEKCKRYRDKKKTSNLQTQNISNRKNVPQQIHSFQSVSPSTRDVTNVQPLIHTSQIGPSTRYLPYVPTPVHSSTIAGPSSRDVLYIIPSHSDNNSHIHSIEDTVLQSQIDPLLI